MRTSKYITISISILATLIFSQCEIQKEGCTDPRASNYDVSADYNDGSSCIYNEDPDGCLEDLNGNLSITNLTNDVLYLYKNTSFETCIPANAEGFIVDLSNPDLEIFLLQIWRADDVEDKNNPDINDVYRQWSVALSNTSNNSERANWIITDDENFNGSGTLNISYPSIDEYGQSVIYQVDVILNNKTGAKIASLQPGVTNKKVSIDYGVQYLYFRYWYSDPNSTSGEITELGWAEQADIIINAQHEDANILIPVFFSNVGKFGEIKVYNQTDKTIAIYTNDVLIENIVKVDGSPVGLSNIPANSSTLFLIPVNEYTIVAKSLSGTSTIQTFSNVDVLHNETVIKRVGLTNKTISLNNYTTETLLLYSENNEYLGVVMKPNTSSGNVLVPEFYDSVVVSNADKTKSKKVAAQTGVNITELNSNSVESFSISTPWDIVSSDYYRSPAIGNKNSTVMEATLKNTGSTTLAFEYKVSSEVGYDFFYFSINDKNYLAEISGEIDWTDYSISLPAGEYTLRWVYVKDEFDIGGEDKVEIRNIILK